MSPFYSFQHTKEEWERNPTWFVLISADDTLLGPTNSCFWLLCNHLSCSYHIDVLWSSIFSIILWATHWKKCLSSSDTVIQSFLVLDQGYCNVGSWCLSFFCISLSLCNCWRCLSSLMLTIRAMTSYHDYCTERVRCLPPKTLENLSVSFAHKSASD